MLEFCNEESHILLSDLVDMFPQSYNFAPQLPGAGDGVVNFSDLLFLAVSGWHFGEVDSFRFDGFYDVQQEQAIS